MKITSTVAIILVLVFLMVSVNMASAAIFTPYGMWHLDESSGLNVSDSSGSNRNCTILPVSGVPNFVPAKLGNGLNFTGTAGSSVTCGNISNFERTQPASYEFWFKMNSSAANVILSNYDGVRGIFIYITAGNLYFDYRGSGSAYLALSTNETFSDNNFHHAVLAYDGSSSASGVKIYVDGASRNLTINKDTLAGTTVSSSNFSMGRRVSGSYYSGLLDEVVVYNFTLTQAQVTFRYNNGTGTEAMLPSNSGSSVTLLTPTNGNTLSTNLINFSFIPIDNYTITSCSLYGNWSGAWVANYTLLSPANNATNSVVVNISDGTYAWNAYCTDVNGFNFTGNSNFTFSINTKTYTPIDSVFTPTQNTYSNASSANIISYCYDSKYALCLPDVGCSLNLYYPNSTLMLNDSMTRTSSNYFYNLASSYTSLTGNYNGLVRCSNSSNAARSSSFTFVISATGKNINDEIVNIPSNVWGYNGTISNSILNQFANSIWNLFNSTFLTNIANSVWSNSARNLTFYPATVASVNTTAISESVWNYSARYTHGEILQ